MKSCSNTCKTCKTCENVVETLRLTRSMSFIDKLKIIFFCSSNIILATISIYWDWETEKAVIHFDKHAVTMVKRVGSAVDADGLETPDCKCHALSMYLINGIFLREQIIILNGTSVQPIKRNLIRYFFFIHSLNIIFIFNFTLKKYIG